jgi:Putative prokaryotic signal transducing protein
MPYCPKCREEFQAWVKTCPDCRIALVTELPVESSPATGTASARKSAGGHEPLVHIADAPNGTVAEMWAGLLKVNQIQCLVKGGNFRAEMNAHSPFLPSGIYVIASEAQRAREILDGLPDSEGPS